MEPNFLKRSLFSVFRFRTSQKSTIYYPSVIPWGLIFFADGIIFILAYVVIMVVINLIVPLSIPVIGLILLITYLSAMFSYGETLSFSNNEIKYVKYKFLIPVFKASTSPANCYISKTYKSKSVNEQAKIDIVMQWDLDTDDFVSVRVDDKEYGEGTFNDKILWSTIQEEAKRYIPYWPENSINKE